MQSHRRYSFLAQRSLCSNDILKGMELKKKTTTCVYFTTEDGVDVFFRKKKKKAFESMAPARPVWRKGMASTLRHFPLQANSILRISKATPSISLRCVSCMHRHVFFFLTQFQSMHNHSKKKKYMFVVIEWFGEKKKGSHVDVTIFSRSKLLDGHGIECWCWCCTQRFYIFFFFFANIFFTIKPSSTTEPAFSGPG